MDTALSNYTVNLQGDALIAACSNAYVRIYDNTAPKPLTADTALGAGAVLLAEPRLAATASSGTVNGEITFSMAGIAPILANGTAAYFRVFKSDGVTVLLDGTIGVTGSGANMIMNSVALSSGAALGVTEFKHALRKQTAGL